MIRAVVVKPRRNIFAADARLSIARKPRPGFTASATAAGTDAGASADRVAMLSGYALPWNLLSNDRGGYKVRLLPGSATFAVPTLALFHHEFTLPIGNTANGTLRTFPDDTGVRVEIDLPDTCAGRDVEELVENKYMTGMSFAIVEAPWTVRRDARGNVLGITADPAGATVTTEAGQLIVNASHFVVDEITVTVIPAFTQTTIAVAEDDEPEEEPGDAPDRPYAAADAVRIERFRFDLIRL